MSQPKMEISLAKASKLRYDKISIGNGQYSNPSLLGGSSVGSRSPLKYAFALDDDPPVPVAFASHMGTSSTFSSAPFSPPKTAFTTQQTHLLKEKSDKIRKLRRAIAVLLVFFVIVVTLAVVATVSDSSSSSAASPDITSSPSTEIIPSPDPTVSPTQQPTPVFDAEEVCASVSDQFDNGGDRDNAFCVNSTHYVRCTAGEVNLDGDEIARSCADRPGSGLCLCPLLAVVEDSQPCDGDDSNGSLNCELLETNEV